MYGYLIGDIVLLAVWLILFYVRKDLRSGMLIMSLLVGVLSMATSYYWWTSDWWHPINITGSRVGLEDFLMGFSSGGIMATIYEEVFRKRLYRCRLKNHSSGALVVLSLLAQITAFCFWGWHFTSFVASAIAMVLVGLYMSYYRDDLAVAGLVSGILMAAVSLLFYRSIIFIYPDWVKETYFLNHLSGILLFGIPIEEFIFWFLAGYVFGPFYEYWKEEGLRRVASE